MKAEVRAEGKAKFQAVVDQLPFLLQEYRTEANGVVLTSVAAEGWEW